MISAMGFALKTTQAEKCVKRARCPGLSHRYCDAVVLKSEVGTSAVINQDGETNKLLDQGTGVEDVEARHA